MKIFGVVFGAALGVVVPGFTGAMAADGSGTSNPNLLRGGYSAGCSNPLICNTEQPDNNLTGQGGPAPVAPQGNVIVSVDCDLVDLPAQDGLTCLPESYKAELPPPRYQQIRPAPYVNSSAQFEADWSVALRGSYQQGTNGNRFGISLSPEASLLRRTSRADFVFGASAELLKEAGDEFRLSSGALEFDAGYSINSVTNASASGRVSVEQAGRYDVGTASNVATAPIILNGSGDFSLRRQFGRFGLQATGTLARDIYSVTELVSGVTQDNKYRNRLGLGAELRAIYALGGNVDIFIEGGTERNIYDAVSPSLGVRLNSWTSSVRAGVSGNWGDVVEVEVSAGYGLRRFDSALLSDAPTALLDAELIYRPNDPIELSALFETNISAPDASTGASAQIEYAAITAARYLINDRVSVRANLGGRWTRFADTAQTQSEYSAGVGADFTVNAHTVLSADYSYELSEDTAADKTESHRVAVGVVYSR